MKKRLVILLAVCLLMLSGCNMGILGKLQTPDATAPALSVTVKIHGEFELILNYAQVVMEVKTLDSDSEALLSDIKLVGNSYAEGMIAILERAREQGLLTDETVISISTQELLEGTWTVATKDMLMRPIERFYEQAGMTLNCDFTPAGEIAPELFPGNTYPNDGHTLVIYETFDHVQYLNVFFYDNGEYHLNYVRYHIWVTWWSDTEYTYSWYEDGVLYAYRVGPGGQFYTQASPVFVDEYESFPPYVPSDTTPSEESIPSDMVPPETAPSDGSTYEATYYSNGNMESEKTTWPNGDYVYATYYEDGTAASYIEQTGDDYIEEHYDGDGNPVSAYYQFASGDVLSETYYSNGNLKTEDYISASGDDYHETYYASGILATSKRHSGDYYIEESFDENGTPVSSFERFSDGGEKTVIYYSNGEMKSSDVIWPNGEYIKERYYEDGTLCFGSQNMDGCLSEDQYDENGVRISSYFRNASGYEQTETYYSNGSKKSLEMIMENGDYEYITYYENGQVSYHLQKQDGQSWEYYYDEDGNRISKPAQ